MIYAQLQQIIFAQLYQVLKSVFEAGEGDACDESMASSEVSGPGLHLYGGTFSSHHKPSASFIKQFLIEFSFLKSVSEHELGRARDLNVASASEKLDLIDSEVSLEKEKCHQVILRALSVALGKTDTV